MADLNDVHSDTYQLRSLRDSGRLEHTKKVRLNKNGEVPKSKVKLSNSFAEQHKLLKDAKIKEL